jgi:hypothetical protein
VTAPGLIWFRLKWPRETSIDQVLAFWRLLGPLGGDPIIAEAIGAGGLVVHRLGIPVGKDRIVARQLATALPGIFVDEDAGPSGPAPMTLNSAMSIRLSNSRRPLSSDRLYDASRALLTVLGGTARDERLILQWVLGRSLPPMVVSNKTQPTSGTQAPSLITTLFSSSLPVDAEQRRALSAKRSEPGWRAVGRIAVAAATDSRRQQLLRQMLGALRTLEAPGVRVKVQPSRPAAIAGPIVPWYWRLRLNAPEMAALSAWPIGASGELPVEATGSRPFPPSRVIRRSGRVLAESSYPGRVRPLALTPSASLRGLHVIGPTGSGKSTALLNLIVQDIRAGRGVAVIEPKGQLIEDVLACIPSDRMDHVVLLDPADAAHTPVGLNPLAPMGRPPELVADQLLAVFHSLHAANWGPRTHDILGASLLTLAQVPGNTLCSLPPLLTDTGFRRRLLQHISDPIGLEPFWAAFDSWSEAERTSNVAPVLNKVRPLLVNPRLRAVLGQENPKFGVRQVFTERKILLVSLAKGLIGPEAAALLGSLVIADLWQATLGRAAITEDRRHSVFVYIDEFQDYLHLPTDLADALSQARGFGVGLTLAHQHLGQLDSSMQAAVLANARSRLCFQLPAKDARVMAPTSSGPEPEDFQSLAAYHCYLQLMAEGAVQPWCSGKTFPPPPATSDPSRVRAASRRRFGMPQTEVDAAIQSLLAGESGQIDDDLTPRRRRPGERS